MQDLGSFASFYGTRMGPARSRWNTCKRKRRLDRQNSGGSKKSSSSCNIRDGTRGAWRGASLLLYLRSCIRRIIRSSSAHVWRVEQFPGFLNLPSRRSSDSVRRRYGIGACHTAESMHVLFFFQNGRRIGDRKMKLILNRMMKCGAYLCTVIVVFLAGKVRFTIFTDYRDNDAGV